MKTVVVFFSSALFFHSLTQFISISEFWPLTLSGESWIHSNEKVSLFFKPVFYLLLSLIHLFPLGNEAHVLASRALFGVIGLGTFAFFILWIQNFLNRAFQRFGLWVLAFLAASPLFFSHVIRIRSDMLALALSVLLLFLATVPAPWSSRRFWLVALVHILLLGTTPRAVFHAAAVISFLAVYHWEHLKSVSLKPKYLVAFIGPYLVGFQILIILKPEVFSQLSRYYNESYSQSAHIWINFWTWVKTEPLMALMAGISFIGLLSAWILNRNRNALGTLALFSVAIISIGLADLKTEYLIASFLPFLFVPFFFVLSKLEDRPAWIYFFWSGLVVSHIFFTTPGDWWSSNRRQLEVIEKISLFMEKNENYRYFDGVGLLPRSRQIVSYVGPSDEVSQTAAFRKVQVLKPEVILYTGRLQLLGQPFIDLLLNNYQSIGPNLYLLKSETVKETHQEPIDLPIYPLLLFGSKSLSIE